MHQPSDPTGFGSSDDFKTGFAALAGADEGGFAGNEYYEQPKQAKDDEEKDTYESKPDPSYESKPSYGGSRAPAQFYYEENGGRKPLATEVHDLTEKPPKQRAPKKYRKPDNAESAEAGDDEYKYPSSAESYYKPPAPTSPGKIVDYSIGKSGSSVSQNPYSPAFYTKLTQPGASPSPSPQSPYEKYSFQPESSDYISSVLSTLAPFNPSYNKRSTPKAQPPENVEKALAENKNCKKIDKQIQSKDKKTGRYKRQTMNCFICTDPNTKSNFEQCTYTTDSAPKNYYASATNAYSKLIPDTFRAKRYSAGDVQPDPYEAVKQQTYQSRPKAFDGKQYQPQKEPAASNQAYQYASKYNKDEPKKSFSEQKADELIKKGGDNCEKVQREEMSCVVCTSAETGGNYEQCSYSSAPAQQKYAYVREQKFDGPVPDKLNGDSQGGKSAENAQSSEAETRTEKPRYNYQSEFHRGREEPLPNYRGEEAKSSEKQENKQAAATQNKPKENRGSARYQIPSHFEYVSGSNGKKSGGRGLDPRLYGSAEEEETEATENQKKQEKKKEKKDDEYEFPSLSEYHFKYFPEFMKEESETAESKIVSEPAKKDVEEVLAEFTKKDRSNCEKAQKNGMTCYLCTDKNGLQHEECMYISESVPKQSHVAYHEKQQVQSKPATENKQPQKTQTVQATKPTVAAGEPVPAASEQVIQKIKFKAMGEEKPEASSKSSKKTHAPKKSKEQSTSESRNDEEEGEASEKSEHEDKEEGEESKSKSSKSKGGEEDDKITDVPEPPTPEEFKVGEKEGAFSEETQPVYSKALGITLPKYMLTKSESEAIFDEFVSSS